MSLTTHDGVYKETHKWIDNNKRPIVMDIACQLDYFSFA